jgi:hypothetical protein
MYLDTPYVLVFYKISPSWIKKKETDWCLKKCPPVTGGDFCSWRVRTHASDSEHIIISSLPDFFHFDGQIFLWMYQDSPSVVVVYKIFPSRIELKETDWCLKKCPPVTGFF